MRFGRKQCRLGAIVVAVSLAISLLDWGPPLPKREREPRRYGPIPRFAGLGVEKLTHLAETMNRETFEPGTVIVRQGEAGTKFYLLSSGTVEVVVDHDLPTQRKVKVLKEGEFFGEAPLLTGLQRSATVISHDWVTAYTLDKAHFETALAASQLLKDQVYKAVFLPQ